MALSVPGHLVPPRFAARTTAPPAAAFGALALVLSALTGLITFTGNEPGSVAAAVGRGVAVLFPIAVGLLIWSRSPEQRFGPLLVYAGLFSFLASLGASDDEVVYSSGRVAGWIAEAVLLYVILAFPSGRLLQPVDRLLVALICLVVAVLFLPTALVADDYPAPAPWTTCVESCPANAFGLVQHEPGWIDGLVVPLRELLVAALLIAVAARLVHRIASATTLLRRTLTPVLAGAIVHAVAVPTAFALRGADRGSEVALEAVWVLTAGLPVLAAGFLAGAVRWRLAIVDDLYRLAPKLQGAPDPAVLRGVLADTLEDPSVELVYRGADHRWLDTAGRPATLPGRASGRAHTVIHDGGGEIAAILHDEALLEQRAFVEAVGGLAMVALANHRLSAQVEASVQEVRRSRERILAVADEERRRIERDLHDGAQQRLVALRIKLELASERSAEQHLPDAEQLHQLSEDVGDALDDVRSLAAGVYPALLVDCGLGDALRSVARRSPVPATVSVDGTGRYSENVEAAVYFCCLEALQNAAKHAEARSVSIVVRNGADLRFEVRDDGCGFDVDQHEGHGLTNIRDRLMAVGGNLVVESAPGRGTRIAGTIPNPRSR